MCLNTYRGLVIVGNSKGAAAVAGLWVFRHVGPLLSVGTARGSNLDGEIAALRLKEVISGMPGKSLQHD